MHSLAPPTDLSKSTFVTCIKGIRDAELKALLTSIASDVEEAGAQFEAAAQIGTFHTLKRHQTVGGKVTSKQMCAVYDSRMAKKRMAGRRIYDRIKAAPENDRCPLCGQRTVSTLDHYLPKAHFPALAVAPANLVPACSDCNKAKGDQIPAVAGEQTLHPYYDDIGSEDWLTAEVLDDAPAALSFSIKPPANADAVLADRVKRHFKVFGLAALYVAHAATELTNIRGFLEDLYTATGNVGVRRHLAGMARSCAQAERNSWQTAMYRSLSTSDWFCSGGFR
jgi:5-methylcytosine-specific restriction endonuclease McrA